MKTKSLLLAVLIAVPTIISAQNPKEISEKSSSTIEFESMEMVTTLNIHDDKGNVRVREVAVATKKFGETTKTLMRFISPPDVEGTSILVYDYEDKSDDMWVFLPSLRKVRRIVSTEKGKSFMGSEFSNADMSKPNTNDFTYKLLGTDVLDGKECWKVEATCISRELEREYGFQKRISYIEKATYLSHKSELFDSRGKVLKTMLLSDFRKQTNGRYFAYTMVMKNEQNNRFSEMNVKQFQLGSKLDENSFAVSNLGKQ
ncbi:MAG TPA: outer membrane lipoprotein-sorting protein [Tenuifilaceae bacterium]|nr:outer membrane lipoprotein-sorting protein [Tenuifilaceae bacterium]HPE18055.1 outer membrane lipoprotein-sorting protein [Tenuifilaceae bacterium]HPJ44582.1 outer membrane lipoprotein-sorting protein [Tenuifilaceae bacterium]HPQ34466.1 outer membrane lipoprotein-sorting protein [Tenuifilaceae bacterium]HRX68777.1 outer membrane lipoprotein-sorting protein [Tenuifilaceae bacterium]